MQKSPLQLKQTVDAESSYSERYAGEEVDLTRSLPTAKIPGLVDYWLADCIGRAHSRRTVDLRRTLTGRLIWFLHTNQRSHCGPKEITEFFAYLASDPGREGRWGKVGAQYRGSLRPATIGSYFHHLRTFFQWLLDQELTELLRSPMSKATRPVVRSDQIQPFNTPQVQALLRAAEYSKYRKRDEAIVLFLLDTGVRVSELCGLRMKDIDIIEGEAFVMGKGNKIRKACFGRRTRRALRAYLQEEQRDPEQFVFLSERGERAGAKLTRWGVSQIIERLGKKANIQGVGCSPHTFRHTFAVEFLRNGGNVFALKQFLGHSGLQVTNRYVALAHADLQTQHRQFSPGDRLTRGSEFA